LTKPLLLIGRGYNFCVPIAFYNPKLALKLLYHSRLMDQSRHILYEAVRRGLFGSTAPHVQVVSGRPGQKAHYSSGPVTAGDAPDWQIRMKNHPHLALERLSAGKAAFGPGAVRQAQALQAWVQHEVLRHIWYGQALNFRQEGLEPNRRIEVGFLASALHPLGPMGEGMLFRGAS
jgi:hypothetical protein